MTPMDRSTNDAKIEKRLRIRKKDDEIVCVLVREREGEGVIVIVKKDSG